MTSDGEKGEEEAIWDHATGGKYSILMAARTQAIRMYNERRKATVANWVALQSIFEVYAQQESGYEGVGWRQHLLW